MRAATRVVLLVAGISAAVQGAGYAQVRVVEWNITNWGATSFASRGAAFQTSFYGVTPGGLQFAPDIVIVEEILQSDGQGAVNAFVGTPTVMGVLNHAPGSPGDWAAAPYMVNGGDTGNALFYRTSKFVHLGTIALNQNTGTGPTQPPRDTQRWHVRMVGYTGPGAEFYLYGAHFKAQGSNSVDRRTAEATRLRNDTNTLPANIGGFLIGADFNIQNSADLAYQNMVAYPGPAPQDIQAGQLWDPIRTPGVWNNNSAFRFIHTQEPSGNVNGGGMDDRHDQLLLSGSLLDRQGLSYIYIPTTVSAGNPYGIPTFSTATWNDLNHSHRCWGNDGLHYNLGILDGGTNAAVGVTIASALVTTVSGGGHLPVYLDMQVPAKLGAPSGTLDFGTVALNSPAQIQVQVTNAADVPRFSKSGSGTGIDALTYVLAATPGFTVPAGTFERPATAAPAQSNAHTLAMDTSSPGIKSGTLTITSDDPDNPTRQIALSGVVPGAPNYDVNADGLANAEDIYRWYDLGTDVDGNFAVNGADLVALRDHDRLGEVSGIVAGRR